MKLVAIMAASLDDVVGVDGGIPWRLSPDLKRFRELTTDNPIVMGRKTFDSIGKPLPNRRNIVISRKWDERHPPNGIYPVDSPGEALETARNLGGNRPIFVIGGPEIWRQLWPVITHVEFTRVRTWIGRDGDTFSFDASPWRETKREDGAHRAVDGSILEYEFVSYERTAG